MSFRSPQAALVALLSCLVLGLSAGPAMSAATTSSAPASSHGSSRAAAEKAKKAKKKTSSKTYKKAKPHKKAKKPAKKRKTVAKARPKVKPTGTTTPTSPAGGTSTPAAASPSPAPAAAAPAGSALTASPNQVADDGSRVDATVPPPASPRKMYWGAWNDRHLNGTLAPWDMSSVFAFQQQVGKGQSLLHFAVPFTGSDGQPYAFPTVPIDNARKSGAIPFLSWSTLRSDDPGNSAYSPAAVAAGRQDAAIRAFADAARAWGKPFFLRFDYEMNGGWFPWGSKYGSNTAADVVAMWRHVHDVFVSAGATNATWVWCPVADPTRAYTPLASLYPGDRYVDWTCIDGYNTNTPRRSFSNVMAATYDEIQAIAPGKPMVIGETGSTERGGSKAAWISDMFDVLPTRFPAVRGLSYFNKNASAPYDDMALDTSPSALQAFAAGVAATNYLPSNFASLSGSAIAAASRVTRRTTAKKPAAKRTARAKAAGPRDR